MSRRGEGGNNGMKQWLRLVFILVGILSWGPYTAAADGICTTIPWGEKLSAVQNLTYSGTASGILYYTVTRVETCGLSRLEGSRVTYGFRHERLYSTLVEIDRTDDLRKIVSLFVETYGLPETRLEDGWDVSLWENDDLRIKLKSQYATGRVKIGMYYKPLMLKGEH